MLEVLLLLLVTAPGCLYVLGAARRATARRRQARSAAFMSGLVLVAVFLASPVAGVADRVLTVHMVQHVVLISVAAPLLAVGRPFVTMLAGLPRSWRRWLVPWRRRARALCGARGPVGAGSAWWAWAVVLVGLVHGVVVAAWHIPVAYDAAVAHPLLHALEHAGFLLTGVGLWSLFLEATRRGYYPVVGAVLFGTMLESIAIGAALALAGHSIYPHYAGVGVGVGGGGGSGGGAGVGAGAGALADQQVAGVVMFSYGGIATLVAAVWLLMRWLSEGQAADEAAAAAGAQPVTVELSVASVVDLPTPRGALPGEGGELGVAGADDRLSLTGADGLGLDRRDGV